MTDVPQHVQDALDAMPSLPSTITLASAGLWAATALLSASLDRNWNPDQLRGVLMSLCVGFGCGNVTDEQLHEEFQRAIDQARAFHARKS